MSNSDISPGNQEAIDFVRTVLSYPFMDIIDSPSVIYYYYEGNELKQRFVEMVTQNIDVVLEKIQHKGLTRRVLIEKSGNENFCGKGFLYALRRVYGQDGFCVRWAFINDDI